MKVKVNKNEVIVRILIELFDNMDKDGLMSFYPELSRLIWKYIKEYGKMKKVRVTIDPLNNDVNVLETLIRQMSKRFSRTIPFELMKNVKVMIAYK